MKSCFDGLANQNDMAMIAQGIQEGNMLVANSLQALNVRIDQEIGKNRKRRRKALNSFIVAQNDRFGVVKNFDDGTQEIVDLTLNLFPDFVVNKIKFRGLDEKPKHIGIYFKTDDFWIIGRKGKVNGSVIFDGMLKNSVVFNAKFRSARVKELLNDFFTPLIAQSKKTMEIPALGGWWNGRFLSAERFMFREEEGIPELPVQKKNLLEYASEDFDTSLYFAKIRQIKDWRYRLLFMLYPIHGILSSIMKKNGCPQEYYLSVVFLDDIKSRDLCDFLQVFGRNKLKAYEPREEEILTAKDEVLILDARSDGVRSDYMQKNLERKCRSFAERIVKREIITEDGFEVSVPVVVFSGQLSRSRYAVNLFLDKNSLKLSALDPEVDIIGAMIYIFVKYCERNLERVKEILDMVKQTGAEYTWLQGAFEVFEDFWSSYGVDLKSSADIPKEIDWEKLLQEMLILNDDIIDDFVTVIRQGISDFPVKEKRRGENFEGFIGYTDEDIWIPTKIFDQILNRYGLQKERNRLLADLRRKGFLITDDNRSYSRQIKSGEKRMEVLQIKRKIFERQGMADIIDLGKEEKGDD